MTFERSLGPRRKPAAAALENIQRGLEAEYRLDAAPSVVPFVEVSPGAQRERVLVRQLDGGLDLRVELPWASLDALSQPTEAAPLDAYLSAVEGVSHFVLLCYRARARQVTTLLELELQAEVDKLTWLARSLAPTERELRSLHERVYRRVAFLHPPGSDAGDRYRLANDSAARLWAQLLPRGRTCLGTDLLRRFYRVGPSDKLRLAQAA